jgi:hypothetical protein
MAPGVETFFSPGSTGGRGGPRSRQAYDAWRSSIDATQKQMVEGRGQIDVKVHAPAGTTVDASSSGIFQKTNIERNVQMQPANSGPQDVVGGGVQ